jgi:hypothetical protein
MTKKELIEYIERSNLAYIKSMWLVSALYKFLLFIKYVAQSTVFTSLIKGYEYFAMCALLNTIIDGLLQITGIEHRKERLSYCHHFFSSLMSEIRLLLDEPAQELNKVIHKRILELKGSSNYTTPLMYFSKRYNLDGYGKYSGDISPINTLARVNSVSDKKTMRVV